MACELLGLDPLYLANEGKMVIIVPENEAESLLEVLRRHPYGLEAVVVGEVVAEHPKDVILRKHNGVGRILGPLSGISVPRLC